MKVLQRLFFSRKPVRSHSDHTVIHPFPRPPQFSVNVQLSDAGRKKLIEDKETIIVLVFFTGHPKEGTEAQFLDKVGEVFLGKMEREIRPDETATFEQINLDSDALAQIDSQGPMVFIEAFSGRRSSKDNLLICEDYEGDFESVVGRTTVLHCQLIEERFPRSGR